MNSRIFLFLICIVTFFKYTFCILTILLFTSISERFFFVVIFLNFFFAEGMFNTGDTVLSCRPFAHVLYGMRRDTHCEECFRKVQNLKRCSGCHLLRYCGTECQKKAWKLHKLECKFLKACHPNVPDSTCRIFFKLLVANHLGRSGEKDNAGLRCFNDLQSNVDQIKGDPSQMIKFMSMFSLIRNYASQLIDYPDSDLLLEVAGKLQTNSYEVTDAYLQALGVGLFLSGSMFDHSCDPNCVFVFEGCVLTVKALKPIPSINDVRVAYCDVMQPYEQRRKIFRSIYYFTCKCVRCSFPEGETLLTCATRRCEGSVSLETGLCSVCGQEKTFSRAKIRALNDEIADVLTNADALMDKNEHMSAAEKCMEMLVAAQNVLHSEDVGIAQLADHLLICYDSLDKLSEAYDIATQYNLLNSMRRFYSEKHPKLAVFHLTLGTLQLTRGDVEEARANFLLGKDILLVTRNRGDQIFEEVERLIAETRRC